MWSSGQHHSHRATRVNVSCQLCRQSMHQIVLFSQKNINVTLMFFPVEGNTLPTQTIQYEGDITSSSYPIPCLLYPSVSIILPMLLNHRKTSIFSWKGSTPPQTPIHYGEDRAPHTSSVVAYTCIPRIILATPLYMLRDDEEWTATSHTSHNTTSFGRSLKTFFLSEY